MNTGVRRQLVPLAAALAVLLVVVVGVAIAWGGPGAGSGDEQGAGSGDTGFADGGGDDGAGAPPYSGTSPGAPGSGPGSEPGSGAGGSGGGADAPDVDAGMIAVAGFYRYDERHLALNYWNGIPECYGDAGVPVVEERPDAVLVGIPRTAPTGPSDTACIDIAVAGSVDITLERPLGDRKVLDLAAEESPVKEAAAAHSETQGS